MSAQRLFDLLKLARTVWDATAPIRDTASTIDTVIKNLEVSPPIPSDDDDLLKIWAVLTALDQNVLRPMEQNKVGEYNLFSKKESCSAADAADSQIESAIKVKNTALLAKIIANDLKSAKTTTGLAIRIMTADFPNSSLYAGREPLIMEINDLADGIIRRCESVSKTRKNIVKDAKWTCQLHNLK